MTAAATKTRDDEDEASRARQAFLDGLATIPVFAKGMNISTRTVQRSIASGELAIVQLGHRKYIDIAASRKTKAARK